MAAAYIASCPVDLSHLTPTIGPSGARRHTGRPSFIDEQ